MPILAPTHETSRCTGNRQLSMAKLAINTGRSIKGATTPSEVFMALVAHITTAGAIVTVGEYAKDCSVTVRPRGFVQATGSTKYMARTNKFLSSVKPAVLALRDTILEMSLEEAQQAAYAVSDAHNIVLPVWDDNENLQALLGGRPFTAIVRERSYVDKDAVARTETYFHDTIMQEVGVKGQTLDKSEFALPEVAVLSLEEKAAAAKEALALAGIVPTI